MQTHPDHDAASSSRLRQMFDNLEDRAKKHLELGDTALTAGRPGEKPIAEDRVDDVFINQLPDDPDCLRVSVGGLDIPGQFTYLVFRGNRESVEEQLRRAYAAIQEFNARAELRAKT